MNKLWLKCAGVRAVKTMAQAALSYITIGASMGDIDWRNVISIAIVSGIYSMLTSIAGLPEVKQGEENG